MPRSKRHVVFPADPPPVVPLPPRLAAEPPPPPVAEYERSAVRDDDDDGFRREAAARTAAGWRLVAVHAGTRFVPGEGTARVALLYWERTPPPTGSTP